MKPTAVDIDRLIPHRRPMRLIDGVLEVGETTAVTTAVVNEAWPLMEGHAVSPIILIELAAQTAGICIGHRERMGAGGDAQGMGWLVGVKTAAFYVNSLPLGTRIVVRAANRFNFELFTEIEAKTFVEDKKVGDIVLQVMQSDSATEEEPK